MAKNPFRFRTQRKSPPTNPASLEESHFHTRSRARLYGLVWVVLVTSERAGLFVPTSHRGSLRSCWTDRAGLDVAGHRPSRRAPARARPGRSSAAPAPPAPVRPGTARPTRAPHGQHGFAGAPQPSRPGETAAPATAA